MASTSKPDKLLAKLDGLLDKAVLAVPRPRDNFAAAIRAMQTVATTLPGTGSAGSRPTSCWRETSPQLSMPERRSASPSSSSGSPCDFAPSNHRCFEAVTPGRRVRRLWDPVRRRGG